MRRDALVRRGFVCLGIAWVALWAAPPTSLASELANAQLLIAGSTLTVAPESQTVPFDTPTLIETHLEGYDASRGVLPADLRVVADFSGPEIDGVLQLETLPNQPLRIPRLRLQGEYLVDNIRLVQGDELLAYAEPRSAVVLVTQVLITRVTSRALTLDEIRSYGIVVDDDSFQAFNFTFAFAVEGGQTVNYNLPVLYTPGGEQYFTPLDLPGWGATTRFTPPRMLPFSLDFAPDGPGDPSYGGCEAIEGDCSREAAPPLPGVILFPTEVSLLHQFFSVVLVAQNGAPAGDRLEIHDLTARLTLPPGLRQARTDPPTPLGVPIPVRVPGPDGQVGTADDLTFLVAQASGEAQALVEGMSEGTHLVQFDLEGVLRGLPGGTIRRLTGQAKGAVVVRDPTLAVTITHPDVVRIDEEYDLLLTVSNTGTAPANLLTVKLPLEKLSGVEVVGENQKTVTVLPGDAQLFEFRLRSKRLGKVVATAVRSSSQITPTFELTVGVGENGIPLSPDAILLPRATESLPPDLLRNALALLGLGYSLATAPPALLKPEMPRVTRKMVDDRVYQLAQTGRAVRFGEDLFDGAAQLAVEWTAAFQADGRRATDWDWDLLRRTTQKGAKVGVSLGAVFAAEAAGTSAEQAFDRFVATTGYLPAHQAALAEGDVALEVSSRTSGLRVKGSGNAADRLRELPFADLYDLGPAEMALLAVPETGGYRARLTATASTTAELHVLVPTSQGALRVVRWDNVGLLTGGTATAEVSAGETSFVLAVDFDGDGSVDDQLSGLIETLDRRPFTALGAVQNSETDPTGHVVEVLFTADVNPESLDPVDPQHFTVPGKISNGGMVKAEADAVRDLSFEFVDNPFKGLRNKRIVRVTFNNPLSPYTQQILTVRGIEDWAGEAITAVSLPVEATVADPGTMVEGKVLGPDGQPVPFAEVQLRESDRCPFCEESCVTHKTAAVRADATGSFFFDYVRQTSCGDTFNLRAIDGASGHSGSATGRVRLIGQTVRLDVVMLGRGTINGRVVYDDGTVPAAARVIAESPVFREARAARIDAFGNYSVGNVAVGTITLSASDGAGLFVVKTVEVPAAGSVVTHDLVLLRHPEVPVQNGEVRGTVFRPDGTTPVSGAYVALYVDGNLVGVRRSGPDGAFDFGPVPAGHGEIQTFEDVTGQSGVQVFFEVLPDQVNAVDLVMREERGAVQGYVYRKVGGVDEPLAGAVVWAEGTPWKTVTDAQGFYLLEGVFAGTRNLSAADLVRKKKVTATVTIAAEGQVVDKNLYFVAGPTLGAIAGEVLHFDGQPVFGATVHLAVDDQHWWRTAATDALGRFILPDLGVGTYRVHGFKGAAGGTALAVVRFAGDTPFVSIRFKKGTLRGRVEAENEAGQPVGVTALLTYRTTTVRLELVGLDLETRTLTTNPDGTWEIPDALVGPYVLTVSNAFYGSRTFRGELVSHGEIATHDVLFESDSTGTIRGTVYDHDGVTPFAGATVNLRHPSFSEYDLTTDGLGRFAFELVPGTPHPFPIQVSAERGTVFRKAEAWVRYTKGGQEMDVEIVLPKQGAVSGRVADANGQPVPGAVVSAKESAYPRRTLVINADAQGNFELQNVFAGTLTLSARAPALGGLGGKTTVEIVSDGQEVAGVTIFLEPTGSVAGQATSPVDGSGAANAEIQLWRGSSLFDTVTADGEGRFDFDLLPLGTYGVVAFDPKTGRNGRLLGLAVTANDQVVPADLVLEARGDVDGHLYEPGSTVGVPGATVALNTKGIKGFVTYSSTGGDGAFELLGIPQGDFTLNTREPRGRRKAKGQGTISTEGERVTVDLFLERQATIVGSVLNPIGAPDGLFPNANTLLWQDGQIIGASLASEYTLPGVILDRNYAVESHEIGGPHRGLATGKLATDGQVRVDVRMHPIGSVVVRVKDSFGNPVPAADVSLVARGFYGTKRMSGGTGADHEVSFSEVGEGNVTVTATNPANGLKGSASGQVRLENEIVVIDCTLQSSGEVRGTAVLPDGTTPVADAALVLQVAGRTLFGATDETGAFSFSSVPFGSLLLVIQQPLGPAMREVRHAGLTANGQVLDLGTVVLDDQRPYVVSVTPGANAVDVALGAKVVVRFSEALDPTRGLVGNTLQLTTAAGATVSSTKAWIDGNTALELTPSQPLANFTTYRVKVQPFSASLLYDPAGWPLENAVQTTFTTADVVGPTVIAVTPANGARQVPLASSVKVTFSEPVDYFSISGPALQLTDVTAGAGVTTTFLLDGSGRVLTVAAATGLVAEHAYQLTLQGIADPLGNVMLQPFTTTFMSFDASAPLIESVLPGAGAAFMSGEAVDFSAVVSDPLGMRDVAFQWVGKSSTDSTPPYQWSVRAPTVSAATDFALTVLATDANGNTASLERLVRVNPRENENAPQVSLPCYGSGVAPGLAMAFPAALSDDEGLESYVLLVDGAAVQTVELAGETAASPTLGWTPPAGSAAGASFVVRIEARDYAGNVGFQELTFVVPAGQILSGNQTLDGSQSGDLVLAAGTFTVTAPLDLASLTLLTGAKAVAPPGQTFKVEVAGKLEVQCRASFEVTGLGYAGGIATRLEGLVPGGVVGAPYQGGGSHGGHGLNVGAGEVYGSLFVPREAGGGGGVGYSNGYSNGGSGGGVVSIAAQEVVLEGEIQAQGAAACNGGSGAGGSVAIATAVMRGGGTIDASGGKELKCSGGGNPGGGGRVAIVAGSFEGFDPAAQVKAWGGTDWHETSFAAPGTVFFRSGAQSLGVLIIDSGEMGGVDRQGVATQLPALGSGAVASFTVDGADAWVSASMPFAPKWLGTRMRLFDSTGTDLGLYRIGGIDALGKARLEGAATVAQPAAFRGEYWFDRIDLKNGAGFFAGDPVRGAGPVTLGGDVELAADFEAADWEILPNALVRPHTGGGLRFVASGRFTLGAGARIDVNGLGFSGGTATHAEGFAPDGVSPAPYAGGGSHGGHGMAAGNAEVYDSVYLPREAGGGGGVAPGNGGPGGGVVAISAQEVVLHGTIEAQGSDNCHGAGAGGTVAITAGVLSGSGAIDASGGRELKCSGGGNPAGGGRVSIVAGVLSGFDVATQVKAWGGTDWYETRFASPGTIFSRSAGQTYGALRVDQGLTSVPVAIVATLLPSIGKGLVGATFPGPDATSLWIEPDDAAKKFSLGVTGLQVRVGGVEYPVIAESADRRRLLLAGAAGAVSPGQAYVGVYKLDSVTVAGRAVLTMSDDLVVGSTTVGTGSTLTTYDLQPPAVTVTQPAAGTLYTAGATVNIAATVTDDRGVASVTFRLGDQSFVDTAAPYAWSVPAPAVEVEGDLPITIEAADTNQNVATVQHLIRVSPLAPGNPPAVAFSCPLAGAVLAPGTGLDLTVAASHENGVERVEFLLGTTVLGTDFAAPYTYRFVAPADAVDGQVLAVKARAWSFSGNTAEAPLEVKVVQGTVFTANATIASTDTSFDGASLVVAGGTLTVGGPHTFRDLVVLDGAKLTHPETTASAVEKLELTLTRDLYVACGGSIDANGRGYLASATSGQRAWGFGNSTSEGAANAVGGSHGGRGGNHDGSNPVYGSFYDPRDPGAGGGYNGAKGRDGGGVIRLTATGDAWIDGAVLANAETGNSGAGGAGGSIRINAQVLSGAGTLQASGSPGGGSTVGNGGGGRIALYGATIDSGLVSRTTAAGGKGSSSDASRWGAAGTVFVKPDAQPLGDLILDNANTASTQWTELLPVGRGVVDAVGTDSFTDAEADFRHSLGAAEVAFEGDFATLYTVLGHAHHATSLTLAVPAPPLSSVVSPGDTYEGIYRFNRVVVRNGARGLARDRVTSTNTPEIGAGSSWNESAVPTVQIASPAAGASYASSDTFDITVQVTDLLGVRDVEIRWNGQTTVDTAAPYTWTVTAPSVTQTTDFTVEAVVTDSSGYRFTAARTVVVNPLADPFAPVVTLSACPKNGDLVTPGAAITIPFVATDNEAIQSYALKVDGVVVQTVGGLNQTPVNASLSWAPPANAALGTVFNLRIEATDFSGGVGFATLQLAVPATAPLSGNQPLTSAVDGQHLVLGSGTYTVQAPLTLASLTVLHGAKVAGLAGQTLSLSSTGQVRVYCGGSLDVAGLGYQGPVTSNTAGAAPAGVTASGFDAGGSHGGAGSLGGYPGPVGDVFGSVFMPRLGGGSGSLRVASTGRSGGDGGGVLTISAAEVVLDGEIRAQGEGRIPGTTDAAGAGGSVAISAETLSGTGTIDASGGSYKNNGSNTAGAGGGGRVALYVSSLNGFDPAAQVKVWGGSRLDSASVLLNYAGPGTVFVKTTGSTYGRLIVDSGEELNGTDRMGPQTPLPTLGSGTVSLFEAAQGSDAWVTGNPSYKAQWAGARMVLLDASGASLGTFQVLSLDASGRALLKDAGAVSGAASYRGQYRFDAVDLRNGAGLSGSDELVLGTVSAEGKARLPKTLSATDLTVESGAVVTPAVTGDLSLTLSGRLTVEPGAVLDVTGFGFQGPVTSSTAGTAPAGVTPSGFDAGGSHGGAGSLGTYPGPVGDVFGSVFMPRLGGGSGSLRVASTGRSGGDGGGVLTISAAEVVLDGEIRAQGEGRIPGTTDAAGAGGSVAISAETLSGTGTIDASGGSYKNNGSSTAGAGGGGRVALYVSSLNGFDPAVQVKAWGGSRLDSASVLLNYAGPGTVFVKTTGSTYGRLIVDNGEELNGTDRMGPQTPLPTLGSGAVTAVAAQGSDAWVTGNPSFKAQWAGARMVLLDASGASLGTFQVLSLDASGRALLKDAGAVSGAASYRGQYRFDAVDLRNGAGLSGSDELMLGTVTTEGKARLPKTFSAAAVTVKAGAVVTPAVAGDLSLTLSGRLTVEPGAILDVSGFGYQGPVTSNTAGTAPAGVTASGYDAGGSHGGAGSLGTYPGPAGDVFGSVYEPRLGGGSGSLRVSSTGRRGGHGGGALMISAAEVVVDGEIRAQGEGRTVGNTDAAGAGGSILILADTLSGSGLIDASGGSYKNNGSSTAGAGGGGRVALYVDAFSGFDPATQVKVRGGARMNSSSVVQNYGGTGTAFVKLPSQTFGTLYVDQGGTSGLPIPNSPLPSVGLGTVGATYADAADPAALWIEPTDPAAKFALGSVGMWVRLDGADYRVVAQTADRRRLLLSGAAGLVDVGDAYRGVYKLDSVFVRGGAKLEFKDTNEVGTFTVDGSSSVIQNVP